jgi:hypothetical protein
MIDKFTFIVVIIKLLGIQIILAGLFLSIQCHEPVYNIMINAGSVIFAIGGNTLLAYVLIKSRRKGGD